MINVSFIDVARIVVMGPYKVMFALIGDNCVMD